MVGAITIIIMLVVGFFAITNPGDIPGDNYDDWDDDYNDV